MKNAIFYLTLLSLLACAHSLRIGKRYIPVSRNKQIVNLEPVQLTEEFNYTQKILFNINEFPASISHQVAKLKILSISTTITTNKQTNTTTNSSPLITKFAISDSLSLYSSDRFDREELIATNQCEKPTQALLAMHTNNTKSILYDEETSCDCMFKLKLAAYDIQNNLVHIFILPILVNDINDHAPTFKSKQINVGVSENLHSKTIVPLESPIDPDSDKYSIQNCILLNNVNSIAFKGMFDLAFNRHTGGLNLIVNTPLDYETKKEYSLEMSCFDGAGEAIVNLIVSVLDANDHVPFFKHENYSISVDEGKFIPELLQIEAVDLDDSNGPNGQLQFSLPAELNTASEQLFAIDETSGMLGLLKPLDYETTNQFTLKVKAQDRGATNSVPVYIDVHVQVVDVNDNAPQASLSYEETYLAGENRLNNTIWIREDVYRSEFVIGLCYLSLSDIDQPAVNGHSLSAELVEVAFMSALSLKKEVESSVEEVPFRVYPITTDYNNVFYFLQLSREVDREKALFYDLKIRLFDNTNHTDRQRDDFLTVRVILLDVNDNKPYFLSTVRGKIDDPEEGASHDLNYYKFFVSENQLKLNFAHIVARDADLGSNGLLEFRILDENNLNLVNDYLRLNTSLNSAVAKRNYLSSGINPNYLFYVNAENGSLSLRGELDREQRDFYLFTIRVNDDPLNKSGFSFHSDILVQVNILDENDNQPNYFTNSVQFNLNENEPLNKFVGNVRAQDSDLNSRTEYTIEPPVLRHFFHIDSSTGNLFTSRVFDAEDVGLRPYMENGTYFNIRVFAKDPEFKVTKANFDQSSILNVTIYLKDLNDNGPTFRNLNASADHLIIFDISNLLSNASNISIKSLQSIDMDRDCLAQAKPVFKINFIRRFSWQFLNEIIKNNDSFDPELSEYIDSLVSIAPPTLKSSNNLRSLFSWNGNATLASANLNSQDGCFNSVDLALKDLSKLNWGIYNFSLQILDGNLKTDLTLKVLVFNTSSLNLTLNETQLVWLDRFLENWWSHNSNLIASFNSKNIAGNLGSKNLSKAATVGQNSNEDIDSFTQEYYRFYASAFSRFNSLDKSSGFNFTADFGQLIDFINYLLFKNTSNSIIALICLFAFISIILVSVIIYKHNQTGTILKKNGGGGSGSSKKMFVNLNNLNINSSQNNSASASGSSFNISDNSSDLSNNDKKFSHDEPGMQQSTKDLTSSPNLVSKFGNLNQMSSTRFTNIATANTAINMNKRGSICDSFTVVATLPETVDGIQKHGIVRNGGHSTLLPSSISSVVSESSESSIANSITPPAVANHQAQSGGTFLSTFSPMSSIQPASYKPTGSGPSSVHSNEEEKLGHQHVSPKMTKSNDLGYYGSSDYSENNNNSSFGINSNKDYHLKQIKQQSAAQSNIKVVNIKPHGTSNSNTSFSSSLLSSPSTSTDSTTSSVAPPPAYVTKNQHHHHPTTIKTTTNPVITTLYPNIYNNNNNQCLNKIKSSDVKIYFERFERIYHSDSLNDHSTSCNSNNTILSNKMMPLNTNAVENTKKNSLTTYSYV